MKTLCGVLALTLLTAAAPAYDAKVEGPKFVAAVTAGHVRVDGSDGLMSIIGATATGCTTRLIAAKDSWEIDWTTASVSDESTATELWVQMGSEDRVFVLRFGDRAQLAAAKLAGKHLEQACH